MGEPDFTEIAPPVAHDPLVPTDDELAELQFAVKERIANDGGALSAARSVRTPWRIALAMGCVAVAPLGMLVASPRADLAVRGLAIASAVAIAALVLGAVVPLALRGFERVVPKVSILSTLVALALLWPIVVAFLPQLSAPQWAEGALFPHGARCLANGLLMAVPALFALRLLDRGGHVAFANASVAAAAAGLSAVVAVSIGCPGLSRPHVLFAHGAIVLVVVAGYVGLRAVLPRRQ
jgi:hypothetical protein